MSDELIAGKTSDEWARFGHAIWMERCLETGIPPFPYDHRPEPAKETDRVIAERIVREAVRHQEAEVERLTADRAALLALWVFENNGQWQIASEDILPPTFATQEEADAAVLSWAHSRKERG